jgi:hypothetical protein
MLQACTVQGHDLKLPISARYDVTKSHICQHRTVEFDTRRGLRSVNIQVLIVPRSRLQLVTTRFRSHGGRVSGTACAPDNAHKSIVGFF